MAKPTINPRIVTHVTLKPENKAWAIKNRINMSDLLDSAIESLIVTTADDKEENSRQELWESLANTMEYRHFFTVPMQFFDHAYRREQIVSLTKILRTEYALNLNEAKDFVNWYIDRQKGKLKLSDFNLKKETEG